MPAPAADAPQAGGVRVMTYNIRYANPGDGVNRWENRRDAVAAAIAGNADIVGMQEVLAGQARDLRERLPGFAWVIRGREVAAADGEACPVVWREEMFAMLDSGTFWLSTSPEVPGSKAWDTSLPRICTWVKLRAKSNGGIVHVFNVHLDHRSAEARKNGAALVAARAAAVAGPVLVLGDFNEPRGGPATASFGSSQGWREVTAGSPAEGGGTFNGWSKQGNFPHIDFILTRGIESRGAKILQPVTAGGTWASDHFPVHAVIGLPLVDRP